MFRNKADRIPTTLFVLYFGVDLFVFFMAQSVWVVFFWMLLGIIPKAFVSAFNHHHQHVPTFNQKLHNRLMELIFFFQTGIGSNGWFLHHVVGHHVNYLDQEKDESRWKSESGRTMGEMEYSLVVALTGYLRAFQAGRRFPSQQRDFLGMLGLTLSLLGVFFYYNWINALFVFALPMMISLFITAWHTYSHHAGLDTDDDVQASYNILDKWFNILTGNLGYHTAHHMRPSLHWSRLPEFHRKIEARIPSHLYRRSPVRWLNPFLVFVNDTIRLFFGFRSGQPVA